MHSPVEIVVDDLVTIPVGQGKFVLGLIQAPPDGLVVLRTPASQPLL
jgi:hypothetical protein